MPVLLPLPLDEPFDYAALTNEPLQPGDVVEVPFGPRTAIGVVWPDPPAVRATKLKAIRRRFDIPRLPPTLLALVRHVAGTTLSPLGSALRLALASPGALDPPAPGVGVSAADPLPEMRLTPGRTRVLDMLSKSAPLRAAELARRAGVGAGVIQGMLKSGLLVQIPLVAEPPSPPDPAHPGVDLTGVQKEMAQALAARIGQGHAITLLEGVPGAGKTEVYLEAVAEALRQGRQALILLPEIALSAQVLDRFTRRFGARPALWHSEVTSSVRRRTWRRLAHGEERIVVGPRSALFLPFAELGLIVVDEEHDPSFKQEDGVCYHARDMALARARLEDCPAILVSATPALETARRAGRVAEIGPLSKPADGGADEAGGSEPATPLLLPSRHGGAPLPKVHLLDLKSDRPTPGSWLASGLRRALNETLDAGEQALLFLNRRGFAPLTLCRACGFRLQCPNCSTWLVTHKLRGRLLCHHCGFTRSEPEHCPSCGALEALVACGPGVERLAEEVAGLLPVARVAIMTSDNPGGPDAAAELLRAMRDHTVDLLIGTQIIAKGHHFPDLTLVGVVDGDLGLAGGDLRAAERQFQLLYQVAGRAGRGERRGSVLIQTHLPEHPVMQALAAGDKDRFYAEELAQRAAADMPPFGRLAALIVSGRDLDEVKTYARRVARAAPKLAGLRVLGPAPAPLALLRGRYRQRLLVMAKPDVDLPAAIGPWLKAEKPHGNLRLQVDVDPYSFL